MSWSVLGHVISEEQSKIGSNGVSNDGRLTIVQCHRYHRPPLLDLYWSSIEYFLYSDEMTTQNQSRKYVFSRSNNLYKHNLNQSFVLSKNANLGFLESITVPKLWN